MKKENQINLGPGDKNPVFSHADKNPFTGNLEPTTVWTSKRTPGHPAGPEIHVGFAARLKEPVLPRRPIYPLKPVSVEAGNIPDRKDGIIDQAPSSRSWRNVRISGKIVAPIIGALITAGSFAALPPNDTFPISFGNASGQTSGEHNPHPELLASVHPS